VKVEVLDVRAKLAVEAIGLVVERASDDENLSLERPVGFDPQKTFTERNKTHNVQDGVEIQIMKLNPIGEEKPAEERMRGKRKPPDEKSKEKYLEARGWSGNDLRSDDENFRRIILQDADFLGALHFLLQEFGLDLVAHGGRVGIRGLGFLHGGAGGGTDGCRTPLAHGDAAQPESHREWKERCEERAVRKEEGDDGVPWP
jgi:hypothetical protein